MAEAVGEPSWAKEPAEPVIENRWHSLDAVRAFALILGVFFHAACSFIPGTSDWVVVDRSANHFFTVFAYGCHSFRMELFFLMAGFFARLLFIKRGGAQFSRNRIARILLPFIVGWWILFPILVYLWLSGAKATGNWSSVGVPAEYRQLSALHLLIGAFASGDVFRKLDLTHLWFLHQLMIVYLGFFTLRALLLRVPSCQAVLGRIDQRFGASLGSRWRLPVLTLITAPFLLWMDEWGVDTPRFSFWPYWPTTAFYGWIFTCGWWLHRRSDLLADWGRRWRMPMVLSLALVIPSLVTFIPDYNPWIKTHRAATVAVWTVEYACLMWAGILGWTGFFVRFCSNSTGWSRYFADASYWIYLIHLPIAAFVQLLVFRWEAHWALKWPLVSVITLVACVLSYQWCVRSTFLGRWLNGRAYPWKPWPWQSVGNS